MVVQYRFDGKHNKVGKLIALKLETWYENGFSLSLKKDSNHSTYHIDLV